MSRVLTKKALITFFHHCVVWGGFFTVFVFSNQLMAQSSGAIDEDKMLEEYISSKGYPTIISFDSSNIKQYWVDNSVYAKDGSINLMLNGDFQSVPLKIQLANISFTQDCNVEIFSKDPISFSINNNKGEVCSTSSESTSFLDYHISSATIHLEQAFDFSFNLIFSAKGSSIVSLKKIVLSFSNNPQTSFLHSPGNYNFSKDDVRTYKAVFSENNGSFIAQSANGEILINKKILITDNPVTIRMKVKNTGNNPARVFIGFAPYKIDQTRIKRNCFPYSNDNQIVKIVSAEKGSDTIVLDSFPQWTKDAFLALNPKEDLSDLPNTSILSEQIASISELPDDKSELKLKTPLKNALPVDTKVRIHQTIGTKYLYTQDKTIQPGEEIVLTSTTQKDDSIVSYTPKAFCRGTAFILPVILLMSPDQKQEATIQILDYSVSY